MTHARALAAFSEQKFDEALEQARGALVERPNDLQILNIAGISAARLGLAGQAEQFWRQSIQINPADAQSWSNLGVLYAAHKRYAEAEQCFRRAIALDPANAETYVKFGQFCSDRGREDAAESQYRAALERNPHDAETCVRLGRALYAQNKAEEAEAVYRQATRIQPRHANGYFFLGNLLCDQERFPEAEGCFQSAIACDPLHGRAWSNLGVLYRNMRRYAESEAAYQKALALIPDDPQWIANYGVLNVMLHRYDMAEKCYRRSLELRPGDVDVIFNLSYVLLLRGRFHEGFLCYEGRYDPRMRKRVCGTPDLPYPQWRGEDIAGKSFTVWHEQGFGDVIQFARFAMVLKERGASRVTFVCMKALRPLLETMPGIDAFVSPGPEAVALPPHDYWTLVCSIPLQIRMRLETIPSYPSYLSALPERAAAWQPRLAGAGPKIGLVWKADKKHKSSQERSLPSLKTLRALWDVPGVSFFSLQKDDGEDEGLNPPPDQPLTHLGTDLKDFADTAAIVMQLDLVIAVDTAIVHVAGALGRPVWALLPYTADWRWQLDREDTPWYASARLFRQTKEMYWNDVIERVAGELRAYAGSRK